MCIANDPKLKTTIMPRACRETVVDGYNLIHKLWRPDRRTSMATLRERLETLLTGYRRAARRHVTIVYDGGSRTGTHLDSGSVDIIFSGTGGNADRRIVELTASLGSRAGLVTVVSSDLEIRRNVVALGASWKSSESFADELAALGLLGPPSGHGRDQTGGSKPRKRPPGELDDREIAQWIKLFDGER